jgi:hypothetical protein
VKIRLPLTVGIVLLFGGAAAHVAQARPGAGRASVSREGPRGGSVDAQGGHVGRFGAGSVEAEGPNGGSVDAQVAHAGRFGKGSVNAEGPNGGTYDASATLAGRYRTGSVDATGVNGGSVSRSATTWTGYRSGYVYRGGTYQAANVVVNKAYVAPVGVYAGWSIVALPAYVAYPQFATYPVEVAVQVQLKQLGYYGGDIDGQIGPGTQKAIAKFQAAQGLAVTGQINQATLKALGIS